MRRRKRNRKQDKTLKTIILLTAILNLFTALLMVLAEISKLLEQAGEGESPPPHRIVQAQAFVNKKGGFTQGKSIYFFSQF